MSQKARVLRALQTHPRGITQVDFLLPDVIDGGKPITRVAARVEELADDGYRITDGGTRDECKVYVLSGAQEAPVRLLPTLPTYHVCDSCSYKFRGSEWPRGCSACGAAVHWLASFHTAQRAHDHVPFCQIDQAKAA